MPSGFSRVQLFASPWAVASQASLSMEFSRQEYSSVLPFSPPGDQLVSLKRVLLAGRFFTTSATKEAVTTRGRPSTNTLEWSSVLLLGYLCSQRKLIFWLLLFLKFVQNFVYFCLAHFDMFMQLACVVTCTVFCVRIPSESYSLLFLLLEIWVLRIWAVWITMLWIFLYMVGFSGVHLNAFLLNTQAEMW